MAQHGQPSNTHFDIGNHDKCVKLTETSTVPTILLTGAPPILGIGINGGA
jgi:hypothetical protein